MHVLDTYFFIETLAKGTELIIDELGPYPELKIAAEMVIEHVHALILDNPDNYKFRIAEKYIVDSNWKTIRIILTKE